MQEILIIITALLFYFLGRYAGSETEIAHKAMKEIKKKITPSIPAGPINFVTPRQQTYQGSEEEKADTAREALFKEQFNGKNL